MRLLLCGTRTSSGGNSGANWYSAASLPGRMGYQLVPCASAADGDNPLVTARPMMSAAMYREQCIGFSGKDVAALWDRTEEVDPAGTSCSDVDDIVVARSAVRVHARRVESHGIPTRRERVERIESVRSGLRPILAPLEAGHDRAAAHRPSVAQRVCHGPIGGVGVRKIADDQSEQAG